MSNIFRYFHIDRVLVSAVPTSSINSAIPVQAIEYQMDINDVVFMVRLEKVVEKLIKYGEKGDTGKMLDTLVEVPTQLVYGVTVALAGFFIMLIPFPGCADWGKRIIFLGLSACGTCICQKVEEDKKKKENKDENN
jgi:hypothetical protein